MQLKAQQIEEWSSTTCRLVQLWSKQKRSSQLNEMKNKHKLNERRNGDFNKFKFLPDKKAPKIG